MKILVVEDTELVQFAIKGLLKREGHSVDVASNGETAIQLTKQNPYDLILMDIGLGVGLDGFETTQCIKKQNGLNTKTPVVALTAHNTDEHRAKAKEVGMLDFVNKPMTPEKLAAIISTIDKQ